MRTPARTRWLIALVLAVATISVATVATATGSGGADRENAGGGEPGQVSPGFPGDPDADPDAPAPIDPGDPDGDCGVTVVGPGTGPDTPVSYEPCPGDQNPFPWAHPKHAQPVEPTPGMDGVRARPFDRAIVNDDGTVTILFTSGVEPCAVLDHVDVVYGEDVTITLFEGHDGSAGDVACIEIAVLKSVTIALDQPLDGRAIVDGASGEAGA